MKVKLFVFPIIFALLLTLSFMGIMAYCLSFGIGTGRGGSIDACTFLLPTMLVIGFVASALTNFLSLPDVGYSTIPVFILGLILGSFLEWLYLRVLKKP